MLSDDFEDEKIEVLSTVVEPEFAFLEVEIKGLGGHAMELCKPPLGKGPEGFDTVDVAPPASEFVLPVLGAEVLLATQTDEAFIPSPAIGGNDAAKTHFAPNNGLQLGFGTVGHHLGVGFAVALKDAEDRCFAQLMRKNAGKQALLIFYLNWLRYESGDTLSSRRKALRMESALPKPHSSATLLRDLSVRSSRRCAASVRNRSTNLPGVSPI